MVTNCDTAFGRLLEADPAELAGRGDSELAVHVRECGRCRAVAEKLLAGQEELAGALSGLRPRVEIGTALSLVRARWRKTLRRERVWRWAPVAAAAAVATAMVLQSVSGGRLVEKERGQMPARIEALVEVPAGQKVMVFETRDQSAKVIWFY